MAHHHRVRAVLVAIPLALITPATPAVAATTLTTQLVSAPTNQQTIKNLRAQVRRLNKKVRSLQRQLNAAKAELERVNGTTTTTMTTGTTTTTVASTTTGAPTTTIAPDCTAPCANANDFKVMITNFKYDAPSGNEFIQPESGNVYVTMDVTFANDSNDTEMASPFDFELEDGAGVVQSASLISPCDSWSSVQLSAGGNLGPKCLAFEATAGQPTGLTLQWKPGLFTVYKVPLS